MAEPRIRSVRLEAAWKGIDVDAAPGAIDKNKGLALKNYLTGEKGRTRARGPILSTAIGIGQGTRSPAGIVTGSDKAMFGRKAGNSATRTVEPWRAVHKVTPAASLAEAYTSGATPTMQQIDLIAGTSQTGIAENIGASNAGGRPFIPGPRFARFGKFVYYIGFDSWNNTVGQGIKENAMGGFERVTQPLRWDPSAAFDMPVNPAIYGQMDPNLDGNLADANFGFWPHGCQDIMIHQGIVLMAGGRRVSNATTYDSLAGNPIKHRSIWYSNVLTSVEFNLGIDDTLAKWQTGGFDNEIKIPGDESDPIIALAPVGRHVGVLARRSVTLLIGPNGTVAATMWQAKPAAQNTGCLDARSVVPVDEGVFFLSQQGFVYFDGVQIRDCSKGLHRSIVNATLTAVGDEGVDGGFAYADRLSNDYILLTIGSTPYAATIPTPAVTFCGLYHIPSDSWSTFSSAHFNASGQAPLYVGRSENRQYASCHQNFYPATTYVTSPESVPEASRGKESGSNIHTRWHSRILELGSPFVRARLKRILIDYEWIVDGSVVDGEFSGPAVKVLDGDGAELMSYSLPSGADEGNAITRQRHAREIFTETQDVQVQIFYDNTARALVHSTILDVWIEYELVHSTSGPPIGVP